MTPTDRPPVTIILESCMDCKFHEEIYDPDPHDSFCSDDVAIVCRKTKNPDRKNSKYMSDRSEFRCATVSCRPYNRRKETTPPPDWCPLRLPYGGV